MTASPQNVSATKTVNFEKMEMLGPTLATTKMFCNEALQQASLPLTKAEVRMLLGPDGYLVYLAQAAG